MLRAPHSRLARYGVAVLVVGLMALVKVLIDPLSDQEFTPFLLFFGAVMVSALFGGVGPGLLTTFLAAVVGVYLFFSPAGSLLLQDAGQALWLLVFLIEGLAICWLGALLRRTRRRSEEAFECLRESEERFRATFEQAAVGIAHIAPDGSWLRVNDRLCEIVGYPREELLEKTFQDITHPDDLDKDLEQARKLLAGEIETCSMEKRYFRRDGSVVWINLTGSLVREPSGEPDYFIAVVEDITRRKRSEELRIRLAAIVESSDAAIIGKTLDGTITSWNLAAEKLYGYSAEEVIEKPITILVPPDRPDEVPGILEKVRQGEEIDYSETVRVAKDGRRLDVSITVSPIRDSSGNIVGASAIARDITKRKRSEEALRESEERFRSAFESTPIGMGLVRLEDGRWLEANRPLCDMLGYPERELLGKTFQDVTHPDDLEEDLENMGRLLAGEIRSYQVEKRYIHKAGHMVWALLSASLVYEVDGKPLYGIAQIEDITARKAAEEALAHSEDRLRTIVETEPECVKVLDMAGCVLEINPAGLALVEADSLEQVLGKPVYDIVVPEYRAGYVAFTKKVLRGWSGTLEFEIVGLKGTRCWLETHAVPLRDARGEIAGLLGITRDITERKQAEEALRESERLYRTVIEEASENIFLVDAGTARIVESNPASRETLGYTQDELRRMTLYDIAAHDRESIRQNMRLTREKKRHALGQRKYRRKDGSHIDVEVSASTILYAGREAFCVVAHDITERVRAQQLLEKRLATLSRIAATLALQGPVEDTLNILAESVVKASTAVACSVVLTDEKADAPHMVGSHGLPEGYAESLQAAYQTGVRSPTMEVFRARHPTLVREVHRLVLSDPLYSSVHHLVREAKWDPVYIVPLISRERALGAINFYYLPEQEPGEDEKVFLKSVADQAAVAVERARLNVEARGKAALEERQRLARELHDSVSQALYGIALGTETARELLEQDPEQAAEPLDYVFSLSEAGIAEMRALIFELRPESLEEEGLVAALEKQAAAVRSRHKLEIEASLCDEPAVPVEVKEAIYRITQEALNNVVKHARARRVRLEMERVSEEITLEISDDGVGFDADGEFPGHLGLRSMRERASKLGGTLEVDSVTGIGTLIRARIPI